jgi:exopolysaccharide biosynthesis polyprenyl glycosylphosphotransferase
MIRSLPKTQFTLLGSDFILIIASYYLSPLLLFGVGPDLATLLEWPDLSAIFTYLLIFYIFDFYNLDMRFNFVGYLFRFVLALIISDLIITFLFHLFNVRPYATVILLINTVLILSLCLGLRFLFLRWKRKAQSVLRVLIIGAGWAGTDLYKLLAKRSDFHVVGFLDDDAAKLQMKPVPFAPQVIGRTDILSAVIEERNVDLVVIAITHDMNQDLHKRIVDAKVKGLSVYDMPRFCEVVFGKIPVQHVSNLWFVHVPISGVRRTPYNLKVKKIIDIMVSLIVLVFLSPAMLIAALAIKVDSPGPVLYVQRRIGWGGKPFNLVKFRSMKVGLENHRELAGQKNDPRITRFGKILRVSRFDELPQLWNVIKGDMSFIGPRALMAEEVNEFTPQIPFFSLRHSIRPGITGWAQVSYPHGARVEDALAKLEYDLYYIKNLSPLLDLIIFMRTVRTVLWGRGAR